MQARLTSISSKPATDRSSGTRSPRARLSITPTATLSLKQTTALGAGLRSSSSWPAHTPVLVAGRPPHELRVAKHPGFGQRGEVPADPVVPVCQYGGPVITPIRR